MVEILDASGNPMRKPPQVAAFEAASGRENASLGAWSPFNYSADAALLPERDRIAARVHDIARNDGWASAALQRHLDNVIGGRFTLNARPDHVALGQTPEWAQEWSRAVESEWRNFAEDPDMFCDAARMSSLVGLFGLMFRHRIADGESLAALLWLPDRGGKFATTMQVIDPDRLSNPGDRLDREFLRGGVEIDTFGAPVRYHVRRNHPGDTGALGFSSKRFEWDVVDRETPFGRRMMIHAFDADRAGQTRGRSAFTPVLKRLHMLGKYDEAELQAAVLNAVLAAWITSPFDHEALLEMLSQQQLDPYQAARSEYYKDRRQFVPDGVQLNTLFPGEDISMPAASHPNTVFPAFIESGVRNVATALGISYEQLSMDWSKTNYSSARAALMEVWKGMIRARLGFGEQVARPIYSAWLEEAIDSGVVEMPTDAPDFNDAKAAWTRCRWIGPGRGWVDPVREAMGAQLRIEMGISTLQDEAAEQGYDWEEQLEQRKREVEKMRELDIPPPSWLTMTRFAPLDAASETGALE